MRTSRRPPSPPLHTLFFLCAPALALALCAACAGPQRPRSEELRADLQQMVGGARDAVFPSLVHIQVNTVGYGGGQERKGRSIGSGVIFTAQGHVLTNQHVVKQGRRFTCTLADHREIPATLIAADVLTDLAVLQLDEAELRKSVGGGGGGYETLPVARFGRSQDLQVGDTVLAMGSPFALSRSVTLGIVSNTARILAAGPHGRGDDGLTTDRGDVTGLFTRWIQHDALILPGSSGGPLVNLRGEVVGVNELGGNSVGFAIPSSLAQDVAKALIAHGAVPRSWLGLGLRAIERTGITEGALVGSVVRGSPAESAGVRPGDVLLSAGGSKVSARFVEEVPPLLRELSDRPVGEALTLKLRRGDKELELKVTPEKPQPEHGREQLLRGFGVTVEEITERRAREQDLPQKTGAMLTGVKSGGPAAQAEPPLQGGDLVRAVDGVKIGSAEELSKLNAALPDTGGKPMLFEFERRGEVRVTLVKPANDHDDDPPRELARGWLGVATQPVTRELAERLGTPQARGYRITRVYPGTLAEKGGLTVGDVVLALGGDKLVPQSAQDLGQLERAVRRRREGEPLALSVARGASVVELSIPVERGRTTTEEALRERDAAFELLVREVTFFDREERRWSNAVQGVLVQAVEMAGFAGLGGVRPGDLIEEIAGARITTAAGFKATMAKISKEKPARVDFVLRRGVRTQHLVLEPDWKPTPEVVPDGSGDSEEN
jgi:serine protease Do